MKKVKKKIRLIIILLMTAALAAAVITAAWHKGLFLPRWIIWQEKTLSFQENDPVTEKTTGFQGNDSTPEKTTGFQENDPAQEKVPGVQKNDPTPEKITLQKHRIQVYENGDIVWESPGYARVQDFLWCDIDHDDVGELLILCWRIGRYGDAKPFWVEKDEHTWSQHIYIYDWDFGGIYPAWMASDIGMDVCEWQFDPKKRLVITETSGRKTGWDWVSWGLSLIWEEK